VHSIVEFMAAIFENDDSTSCSGVIRCNTFVLSDLMRLTAPFEQENKERRLLPKDHGVTLAAVAGPQPSSVKSGGGVRMLLKAT
jgi:hypothetical protein